jgi:hypothetical protein
VELETALGLTIGAEFELGRLKEEEVEGVVIEEEEDSKEGTRFPLVLLTAS